MPNDKSKTSKTARVMNLLSKKPAASAPAPDQPAEETEAVIPEEAKPAPHSPPILSSIGADAAASDQIRNALEDALAEELAPPAPQPAAPAAPQPAAPAAPQPAAPVTPQPASEPAPVPVQAAEPDPVEPKPAPDEPVHAAPRPTPAAYQAVQGYEMEQPGYINVMQVLVEEKAAKYVKMFGLCDCKRCLEDVKALALNHLPPKYVVMDQGERVPKLTFYEGKYNSDITAQLLKACQKVAERPHHTRN